MDEVARLISIPAAKKELAVESHISESVPQKMLGDEAKIRQTLLNLAHNAEKFTREGAVKIIVDREIEPEGREF